MINKIKYIVVIAAFFIIGYIIGMEEESSLSLKRSQIIMGTVVEIEIRGESETKAQSSMTAAFDEVKRIDSVFSTYISGSPVYRINNSDDSIITVNNEIYDLLLRCDSLWRITNGAFDVSIGSLIDVWGFETEHPEVPAEEEIHEALKSSGWLNIEFMDESGKIKRRNNIKLNFGAIAKGYAADKAIEILKNEGVTEALVNVGGEINKVGNDWVAGIQHPRLPGQIIEQLQLHDMALATSGDYEKYFESGGKRYNHILNPADGYSAQKCQSVSVIAPDALTADVFATAIFVLGFHEGLELVEKLINIEAMIIDAAGNKYYSKDYKTFQVNNKTY